jgi:hypothetical protein
VQLLVKSGVLVPSIRGRGCGDRHGSAPSYFSVMQTIAVAYGEAFKAAGAHASWADEAVRWVASRHPGELLLEFARGRTVLFLLPGGGGLLADPKLGPETSREHRTLAAALDLEKCYERVWRRLLTLAPESVRPKLEALHEENVRKAALVAAGT